VHAVTPPPPAGQTPPPTPNPADVRYEPTVPFRLLDFAITALILIGGADRIERFLKAPGSSTAHQESQPQPLEIKGKITLEDPSGKIKQE
jgi:hypothetical protein